MRTYLLPLILLMLGMSGSVTAADNETWKITSLEVPPYASSKMANGGNAIASLRNTLAKQGIELNVEYLPWQDAIEKAEQPGYLGYYPAWLSEIKPGFIASPTIFNSQLAVLTNQQNEQAFDNLEKLFSDNKVAVVDSYVYPGYIENIIQAYDDSIIRVATDEQLFILLTTNQVKFVISAPEILGYFAIEKGLPEPKIVRQFTDFPLVIGIKNTPENQSKLAQLQSLFDDNSQSTTHYIKPKKLLFTYIDIPHIAPFKQFMETVYDELNIKTQLQAVPSRRGVLLLNAGIVDGDIVRSKSNLSKFDDIIVVEPSLGTVNIVLICRKSETCNRTNLDDKNISIMSSMGDLELLKEFNIQARVILNEDLNHILRMLKKGRVDNVLYPALEIDIHNLRKEFEVVVLRQMTVNTVVHKKHAGLVPELSHAIKAHLPSLTDQLNSNRTDNLH